MVKTNEFSSTPSSNIPDILAVSRLPQPPLLSSSLPQHYSIDSLSSNLSQDQSLHYSPKFHLKKSPNILPQYPFSHIVGHHHQQQQQQSQQFFIKTTSSTTATTTPTTLASQELNETEKLSSSISPASSTNQIMIDDNEEFINSEFYIDESLTSSINDDAEENDEKNYEIMNKKANNSNNQLKIDNSKAMNISSSSEEESLIIMQTIDKSTSTSITFNNRKSMEMVLTLLQVLKIKTIILCNFIVHQFNSFLLHF